MKEAIMDDATKVFDSESPHWSNNEEMNGIFLQIEERYANHILRAQGFLFLNDVFSFLGLKKTAYGQKVGWTTDGLGYVDFGIKELTTFSSVLLKFNVDGEIWDRIDRV